MAKNPTQENLKAAFAGESQANRMYTAFAKRAATEGWHQIAKLFRAAAAAETVHALAHFRVMGGVKGTADNLATAIAGEGYEFQQMYPEFVAGAEAEGNKPALNSFKNAMAVEETHYRLYSEALESLKAGKDLPAADIFVCEICGHTHVGEAPDECPVCGAKRERFSKIE
jgi:rubrerythrin